MTLLHSINNMSIIINFSNNVVITKIDKKKYQLI